MRNILLMISVLLACLHGQAQNSDSAIKYAEMSDEEKDFQLFLVNFKWALEKNDNAKIAGLVFYPLHTAYGSRQGTVNVANKKAFLKLYSVLLDKRMKEFLL